MIFCFSLFIEIILIWRGIFPQKIKNVWKIIAAILTTLIVFKFYVFRLSGAKMFAAPQLPPWILLTYTWLYAVLVFAALFLIVFDLSALIIKLSARYRKKQPPLFLSLPVWKLAVLIPAMLLVSLGMYEGLKLPETVNYEISFADLPDELDGFKIAHLSDIHADPFTRREKIRKIVSITNEQNADLIVITGDFVDGRTSIRGKDLEVLKDLKSRNGVFGVPGNHEYYSGYDEWMTFLRGCGITMLENEHTLIADGNITLAGVTDPAANRIKKEQPDIQKAFAGSPENNFRILLAHQPRLAYRAAKEGVDLQLSGHTHGGMIRGMDFFVALFNRNLVSGTCDIDDMKLHISNGTGIWNGFPLRLGRNSEIVIITLKKRP